MLWSAKHVCHGFAGLGSNLSQNGKKQVHLTRITPLATSRNSLSFCPPGQFHNNHTKARNPSILRPPTLIANRRFDLRKTCYAL